LEQVEELSLNEILARVNVSRTMAEKALKLLEVDGAVGRESLRYFRTPNPWRPDYERIGQVTVLRRAELAQMQAYVAHAGCLMEFLARALDDPTAGPCGKCANCQGRGLPAQVSRTLVAEAVEFLKRYELVIEPRKQWPTGLFPDRKARIPPDSLNAPGRALCEYGDAGWGKLVRDGKYVHRHFDDRLVQAAAELIRERWRPDPPPEWVTAVPSRRHPRLVYDFAKRLAAKLGLPFASALVRTGDAPEQKTMENSAMQARNVQGTLAIAGGVQPGPVLLVDDMIDSGWTLTFAGWLLRTAGSGTVYPFVLARAAARKA
jgi:ATP-dependent DNA helicase RecQ